MCKWKRLWIFALVLCASSSVRSQSDEGGDLWSDDYEQTNNLEALFKNINDYDDTLNSIKNAREEQFQPDYVQEDEPVNNQQNDRETDIDQSKDSLQVEDVRFDSLKYENNEQENDEYVEDIVDDKNMNGNAPPNEYDENEYKDYVDDIIMESPYNEPVDGDSQLFDDDEIDKEVADEIERFFREPIDLNNERNEDAETSKDTKGDPKPRNAQENILNDSEPNENSNDNDDSNEQSVNEQIEEEGVYEENNNEPGQIELQNISQEAEDLDTDDNNIDAEGNSNNFDDNDVETKPDDTKLTILEDIEDLLNENSNDDDDTNRANFSDQNDDMYEARNKESNLDDMQSILQETKNILSEADDSDVEINSNNNSEESNEEVIIPQLILEETKKLLNEEDSNMDDMKENQADVNQVDDIAEDSEGESSDMDVINQQLSDLWDLMQNLQNSDYNNDEDDPVNLNDIEDNDSVENVEVKNSNENVGTSDDSGAQKEGVMSNDFSSNNIADKSYNDHHLSDEVNDVSDDTTVEESENIPDKSDENTAFEWKHLEESLNAIDQNVNDNMNENIEDTDDLSEQNSESISTEMKDILNSNTKNVNENQMQNDGIKYYSMKELTELSSQELNEIIDEYGTELKEKINNIDTDPVHYKLSLNEPVVVHSPNYPEPYGGNTIVDWFFDGEGGSGIELNITEFSVDGNSGDYLLIKPGKSDVSGDDGLIFTYMLRHERKYRFIDVDSLFVRFESKGNNFQNFKGFQFSVKFIEPKVDRIIEPEPLPEPSAQVPEETLTLHLTGFTPYGEEGVFGEFKSILVDMAAAYIDDMEINLGELPLDEVVQLTSIVSCNINWPYSETCAAVTFGIPLYYSEEHGYKLTKEELVDMWTTYAGMDPFASKLRALGIESYEVPNERRILSAWWSASFAVLIIVFGVGYAIWRWNCFEDYSGMTRLRDDSDSMHSGRKSDLSLYPTPHQDLPPMFADSKQYEKYLEGDFRPDGDTTRVDLGGAFTNKSFVRDGELMDLDSDEEIIMSLPDDGKRQSYTSGIRPRDVYDV